MENIEKELISINQQVRQAEENHLQNIQKNILTDLKTLRKQLLEDIEKIQLNQGANQFFNNDEQIKKLKYRIKILTNSLQEKLENKREKELEEENKKLKYRIQILTESLKEKIQ